MNKLKLGFSFIAPWFALFATISVVSEEVPDTIPESRYVSMKIGATADQMNPLNTVLQMDFPESVVSIGQALVYLLKSQGYVLELPETHNQEQYVLLNLPLQYSLRHIGPITLKESLNVLGGEAFDAEINPVTRSVSFRLKTEYLKFINSTQVEEAKAHWIAQNYIEPSVTDNQSTDLESNKNIKFYGPVKKGETLAAVAIALYQPILTRNQLMVLLFRNNPQAFKNGNINNLFSGVTLRFPGADEFNSVSVDEANTIVREHNQSWSHEAEMQ